LGKLLPRSTRKCRLNVIRKNVPLKKEVQQQLLPEKLERRLVVDAQIFTSWFKQLRLQMQASYKQSVGIIRAVSMKNSQDNKEDSARYGQDLKQIMDVLKINQDSQVAKTAFELMENSYDALSKLQHVKWVITLNAVAGSCFLNQRVLSQSEMYDFLTVAVTTSLQTRTKGTDDMIFRIYKDIMANYEGLDDKLRIAYPKLIVDVVAILAKGVDTRGNKIAQHNLEHYYQTRKSDLYSSTFATTYETPVAVATAASIKSIKRNEKREKPVSSDDVEPHLNEYNEAEIVEALTKITNRSKKDIQSSLSKLERKDIQRINDLCKNYTKIQEYSKLITDRENSQKFKSTLERDIGRKLSSHQIQHAANSIRKGQLYIENVLDGKFIPHGSYGINHTKHNLEYGYLIVGLMQSSRKNTTTKKEDT
jgi:hypothetical protein